MNNLGVALAGKFLEINMFCEAIARLSAAIFNSAALH